MILPSSKEEKRTIKLLKQLQLVSKEVRGSFGYKLCRRNEIRGLTKVFCSPALFITINPSNITNPLIGVLGGVAPEVW